MISLLKIKIIVKGPENHKAKVSDVKGRFYDRIRKLCDFSQFIL